MPSAQGSRLRGATERARKRYRLAKGIRARTAAERKVKRGKVVKARRDVIKYESALAAFRKALRRPYPHLSGDLDAKPEVLRALECIARKIGRNIYVTSGRRSEAEQKRLYDNRHSNPFPVAFCCPCSSQHCLGNAADALVGGVPIQNAVSSATIASCGLYALPGDAVHVQLP